MIFDKRPFTFEEQAEQSLSRGLVADKATLVQMDSKGGLEVEPMKWHFDSGPDLAQAKTAEKLEGNHGE